MYIIPTVIGLSNGSPVLPSYRIVLPSSLIPACFRTSLTSSSVAPSKTGVDIFHPKALAAPPK